MSIQVMLVAPWKKVIGKIKKVEDGSYEVTDGWLLEELHTREGLSIVPMPIFPSNEKNGVYRFNPHSVIIDPTDVSDEKILDVVSAIEDENNITLAENQKEAVIKAVSNSFLLLTGGAGTGKTTN